MQILPFLLDGQRYGLPARLVDHVLQAVEITPLPQAPPVIAGVIDIRGRIVAVVDIRRRLHLPPKELSIHDVFILARTGRRPLVVVADEVMGVADIGEDAFTAAEQVAPGHPQVAGIAHVPDGMIIIHDLDRFLSLDEEEALGGSMRDYAGAEHARE